MDFLLLFFAPAVCAARLCRRRFFLFCVQEQQEKTSRQHALEGSKSISSISSAFYLVFFCQCVEQSYVCGVHTVYREPQDLLRFVCLESKFVQREQRLE